MPPAGVPRLTISSVEDGAWLARAEPHRWIREGCRCLLLSDGDRMLWACATRVDASAGTCRLQPEDASNVRHLASGDSCRVFDGYWGDRVEIVLAPREWRRTEFAARDTVESPAGGGTWARPLAPGETVVEGPELRLVPGGWDHEHCEICWRTIGAGGDRYGFLSDEDVWICERCRVEYVVPRSLAFVVGPGE